MNLDWGKQIERRIDRTSLLLTLVLAAAVLAFHSAKAALSLGVGGALSYINFHWLRQAVDFIVLKGAQGRIWGRVTLRYTARYALIGVVLYVTIRTSRLDLIWVFSGLFVYVFAVLIECISEVGRTLVRDYRNGRT